MDKELRRMKQLVVLQDLMIKNVVEKIDVEDMSKTDPDEVLTALYDYTMMISAYLAKAHISVSSGFDKTYADILTSESMEDIQNHYKKLAELLESSEFKRMCK